jgi:ribosomal protein L37AE/L43A
MQTTKEKCIVCGHVANVKAGSKLWACAECGRMQRTAALQAARLGSTPLDRLRYHVSGAIERGETQAITVLKP